MPRTAADRWMRRSLAGVAAPQHEQSPVIVDEDVPPSVKREPANPAAKQTKSTRSQQADASTTTPNRRVVAGRATQAADAASEAKGGSAPTKGNSPAAAAEHPTLDQQPRNPQNVAASDLDEPVTVATLERRLEEERDQFQELLKAQQRQITEQLERQRRMDLLRRLLMILCPPATYGRGSSVAPSLFSGKMSTKSNGSNNSRLGEAVELDATDSASRVLFTVFLLRSTEGDAAAAVGTNEPAAADQAADATLKRLFMTNAHILGRAEIGRFLAQEGEACAGLKKMLDTFIFEEQGKVCRNIVKMVKGFELAMDEHAFTFVPDFDADSEYAWKVHVFDRDYEVDVTTVNNGNPNNRNEVQTSQQRTTLRPVNVGGDTAEITKAVTPPTRYFYTLNELDGRRIDFQNRVSIRCLLVRSLSAFYVKNELTDGYLERLLKWAARNLDSTMKRTVNAAGEEPTSSLELIREWLHQLQDG